MRKKISLLLTVATLFTMILGTTVSAADSVTYSQANEIAEYCYQGYNSGAKGPIIITKGILTSSRQSKTVYLVTLSGTEFVDNQSTGVCTDLLAGFNQSNPYLKNTVNAILNNIPKNSNLVLAGHSLGGMIAQQVAADPTIKNNYNVLNTVTFGSPLLCAGSREGTVKRLGDSSDVVPYLSATGSLSKEIWKIAGLQREDGGYGMDCYHAHTDSYLRSDKWGSYDVTGTKNGSATLTLDLSTQQYIASPTK